MSPDQLVAPAGARGHSPAPALRAPDRVRLWPRLVAHLDAKGIQVAIERSDRRLYQARHLPAPFGPGLADALRRYLGAIGQPVAAGVIVIDGQVSAGRFYAGHDTQGVGIESLRLALGLRALHVIDEQAALRHGAGVPDDDEHIVAAFMRSRGVQPVFGNLLGGTGITRAFEALSGIDDEWPGPLPAVAVVALAARDDAARRACVVVCGAIAQLCGLLSLDGARRVLLAGPVAGLLQPALGQYPIAARLSAIRGNAADAPTGLELGVLAQPIRYIDGARRALDETLREMFHDAAETVGERVRTRYAHLTPSEQRVADLVLSDPAFATSEPISAIARAAGVSQPQVIRFCRTLGFRGLTDFKLTLVASLARSGGAGALAHRAPLRR
jgi:glucokinase